MTTTSACGYTYEEYINMILENVMLDSLLEELRTKALYFKSVK